MMSNFDVIFKQNKTTHMVGEEEVEGFVLGGYFFASAHPCGELDGVGIWHIAAQNQDVFEAMRADPCYIQNGMQHVVRLATWELIIAAKTAIAAGVLDDLPAMVKVMFATMNVPYLDETDLDDNGDPIRKVIKLGEFAQLDPVPEALGVSPPVMTARDTRNDPAILFDLVEVI